MQVQNFYEKHHRLPFSVTVICPGSKIPEWFSCETEGCSINIKLPLQWYDANFLGFAVAIQYLGHLRCFSFKCKSSLKTNEGESCYFLSEVEKYSGISHVYTPNYADHVLAWYQPSEYKYGAIRSTDLANTIEATFHFTVTDFGPTDMNTIIQRCGVCFLYSQANDMNFEVI